MFCWLLLSSVTNFLTIGLELRSSQGGVHRCYFIAGGSIEWVWLPIVVPNGLIEWKWLPTGYAATSDATLRHVFYPRDYVLLKCFICLRVCFLKCALIHKSVKYALSFKCLRNVLNGHEFTECFCTQPLHCFP